MSIIKSFFVGKGDMFYINHNSDNLSIIDCYLLSDSLPENRPQEIIDEIKKIKKSKTITRFISTHPDKDHYGGLDDLDDALGIINFYCVKNKATKSDTSKSFERYCMLRDSDKAFYIEKGSTRKWMNENGEGDSGIDYGSSGINILWPDPSDENFKEELKEASKGGECNNISPIITYSANNHTTATWMGDLENEFMEKIKDKVSLPKTNILFAPHHGRSTSKVPSEWIEALDPDIIVMGNCESKHSDYSSYSKYNKIRQNSAKDITFEILKNEIHVYCSNENYEIDFLDKRPDKTYNKTYKGTLNI